MSNYATFDEIRIKILILMTELSWRQGENVETFNKGLLFKKTIVVPIETVVVFVVLHYIL